MHEYGHTFDSQKWRLLYLPVIGIARVSSAETSKPVPGEPWGVTSHDFQWYEMSANRHTARYFGQHYGVDWNGYYKTIDNVNYTIEDFYPRKKRK